MTKRFLKVITVITGILLILFNMAVAQEQPRVKISREIQNISGKDYYIHTVEEKQTVYAISRAYDVSVEEIYFENPESRDGIRIGQRLLIPLISRDKVISRKLNNAEFDYIFHIVKKGETLYQISNIYNITVDDLVRVNPEAEKALRIGQYLKIPLELSEEVTEELPGEGDTPVKSETSKKIIEHVVQPGETLYSISQDFLTSVEEMQAFNQGLGDTIKAGDIIYIPYIDPAKARESETKPAFIEHTVKQKETLFGIARSYGVSINDIREANPGVWEEIKIGQKLTIPTANEREDYIRHTADSRTRINKLARLYSIEVDKIREINPRVGRRVRSGETVRIPLEREPEAEPKYKDIEELPPEENRVVDIDSIFCLKREDLAFKSYKVALMLPLYLDEVDSVNWDRQSDIRPASSYKSLGFIQFYEGVLLAADSLKKKGMNLELFVFDVDDDISKTINVLQYPDLPEMDLIIGPLFKKSFKLVSNFSRLFDINIINPLTTREEILEHDNIFKVKPSYDAQIDLVNKHINKYYPNAKIIIVRHNKYRDLEMVDKIRAKLERNLPKNISIPNETLENLFLDYSAADTTLPAGELLAAIKIEDVVIYREFIRRDTNDSTIFINRIDEVIFNEEDIQGIQRKASIIRPTVIIAVGDNKVFGIELLTKLNELRDTFDITLIGMPEWGRFDNLESEYLMNLNTHFVSSNYIDYNDSDTKNFINKYRRTFFTEPSDFAFEGFDVAYFFLSALNRYGKDFHRCMPYYEEDLFHTSFRFKSSKTRGFENQYWNIYKFKKYALHKLN